jgi:DNA repair protein RadC
MAKVPAGFSEVANDLPHYAGHRERLRDRFREGGEETFADYELLELVLFRAIPRRDVKPMAKELIKRFGSFAETITAPAHLLLECEGISQGVLSDFKVIEAASRRIAKGKLKGKTMLASWSDLLEYCHTLMAFEAREVFHVLYLDKRNTLIADERQGKGTVDHTPVYPREVIKRALELSATAIILLHNHPSGDPEPSQADILMTHKIMEIASPMGIVVHDHIIIGKQGHASLRGMKLM